MKSLLPRICMPVLMILAVAAAAPAALQEGDRQ